MKTLPELFESCVEKYSDNVMLLEKSNNKYKGTTFREVHEKVHQFAAGLIEMGLEKNDRVALLSDARNDWVISELGIFYAGAVNVPLSVKLTEPSDVAFRISHSGARFVILSKSQVKKVLPVIKELKKLEKIILLDPDENFSNEMMVSYQDIMKTGKDFLSKNKKLCDSRWKSITGDDYANICYTSGTTADPKGIILSHRNYTANIEQSLTLFSVPRSWTTLGILPWDHAFTHTCGIYTLMSCGASLASVQVGDTGMETLKNIPVNIKENRPHLLLSVPSLAKNFRKNIEKGIKEKGAFTEKLFNFALKTAYAYNGNGFNRGKGLRSLLKPVVKLFDRIIFRKIRENFGGRLEYFVGGGALLDIELQKFFYAIGMPMYQGYGLTEASPVISANNPKKHKMGSSGIIAGNMEVVIRDENGNPLPTGGRGEITVKGENVMKGYWENQQTTAETIKDNWLYSGDMGYFDEDGFLFVLGRFKSLLIADDGEKYSPEGIEEALIQHSPFIEQCLLYNNQNAYTTALIYPNVAAIKAYAAAHKDAGDDLYAEILKIISSQINQFNTGGKFEKLFQHRWLPSTFAVIVEGFTEENHLMNSVLKVVRPKVIEKYKSRLEKMYSPQGKNFLNEDNINIVGKLLS